MAEHVSTEQSVVGLNPPKAASFSELSGVGCVALVVVSYVVHVQVCIHRVMAYDANVGPGLLELTRQVPAAYDCGEDGCGGGLGSENPDTVIFWEHGICVSQETCQSVDDVHCTCTAVYMNNHVHVHCVAQEREKKNTHTHTHMLKAEKIITCTQASQ